MIGHKRIGCLRFHTHKGLNLIFQEFKHYLCVKLRVIHTARLKASIMIVLYQMMIRVAGKGDRI